MYKIEKIKEVAEFLNLKNILLELNKIEKHQNDDAAVILPLIGEFSAGKTTLINALTDIQKLETNPKPTTSTIYEIHFGCNECKATILNGKNELRVIEDISKIKNDELDNVQVVTVFDTSKKVPSSLVIVDTPGLSSPYQSHRQTLVDFLPQADGILLTVDVNAQLTKSLIDFVNMMNLSSKPLYLVLTHKKDKTDSEILASKEIMKNQLGIPLHHIVAVDSIDDDLQEIHSLFAEIQKSKKEFLEKVDDIRISGIIKLLLSKLDELMKMSDSNEELETAIRQQKHELEVITRKINNIVDSVSSDIESNARSISRKFEDTIQTRLNSLVLGSSNDYDAEAISTINSTASLLLQEFKSDANRIMVEKIKQSVIADNEISDDFINEIDLSNLTISGLTYNMDLTNMGHQYDNYIKTGVIVVAAALVAATGGAAAGAATGTTAGATVGATTSAAAVGTEIVSTTIPTTISVIDSATDVASIVAISKLKKRVIANVDEINGLDKQIGEKVGNGDKGFINSLVGLVTEKTMSRPQRLHAIRVYVDGTLSPEFRTQMDGIVRELISTIRISLQNQTNVIVAQKAETLRQLQSDLNDSAAAYNERIKKIREYKISLLS